MLPQSGYSKLVYSTHNAEVNNNIENTDNNNTNKNKDITYTYNANATVAEVLGRMYYYCKTENKSDDGFYYNTKTGEEEYTYLKKIKKPYIATSNEAPVKVDGNSIDLYGKEYYGMYLGETYYIGKEIEKKALNNDTEALVKVNNILDYVDNDFTFELSENNTKNKLWQATTSKELWDNYVLDHKKASFKDGYLVDKNNIRYDTDRKSNLALSVDSNKYGDKTNKNGNESLSEFLETTKGKNNASEKKTNGIISVVGSKVLSADDVSTGTGLQYENIAEIVQYISMTGRRTKLPRTENGEVTGGVIGNAKTNPDIPEDSTKSKDPTNPKDPTKPEDPTNPKDPTNTSKPNHWTGYESWEADTDAAEVITISPPTGAK